MLLTCAYKSASFAAMTLLLQVCPKLHIKPHVLACCLHASLALQLPFESCVSCICALTSGLDSCLVQFATSCNVARTPHAGLRSLVIQVWSESTLLSYSAVGSADRNSGGVQQGVPSGCLPAAALPWLVHICCCAHPRYLEEEPRGNLIASS